MKRFAFAIAVSATTALAAGPLKFESAETHATLVELFSSEGCSSCPPADAWISSLKDRAGLWERFVPVVWHVDYWDRLGWPDRFARPEFTERQRRYAAAWSSGSVYTPGFVANGREWRAWGGAPPAAVSAKPGILRLTMTDRTHAAIVFTPTTPPAGALHAELALLGGALESDVTRGENRGRKLRHDFTVLHFVRTSLTAVGSRFTAQIELPAKLEPAPNAIAAWVVSGENPAPMQATGGWLREAPDRAR